MCVCVLKCAQSIQEVTDIEPNSIHMAWQIPQYFLMTAGEVVFSVTGLEFSYSQVQQGALHIFWTTLKKPFGNIPKQIRKKRV